MNAGPGSDFGRALDAWRRGDGEARDAVFALTYDELRAVARRQLAHLKPGQTLAPTMLVHEAFLKFADRSAPAVVDRGHFLSVAARAMRMSYVASRTSLMPCRCTRVAR